MYNDHPTYPLFHAYMRITRYPLPQNQGKLPRPLLREMFGLILHDFIRKNDHKTSQVVTLFPSLR